jgi:hypothetical protein
MDGSQHALIFEVQGQYSNFFSNNWVAPIFKLDLYLFIIHLYTKYHLNPSNYYWENAQNLSLSRVWRTDGWTLRRKTGWTSPYHNTSRFQQAYKNGQCIQVFRTEKNYLSHFTVIYEYHELQTWIYFVISTDPNVYYMYYTKQEAHGPHRSPE